MRLQLTAAVALVGALGCSSEPDTPPQPVPTNTVPMPPPPAPPPPPPAPTVDVGPCDATMTLALQTSIQAREKTELKPGMKPEGTFMCEKVAEAGVVRLPITIQPDRCYTVLAGSFPNITDIDVVLKPNLGEAPNPIFAPIANTILAQDGDTGLNGSIGKGQSCYKFNLIPGLNVPLAAVVEITAKAGSGPVAVQAYSKAGK